MANYYCTCRTNYFEVKDEKTFRAWAAQYPVEVIEGRGGFGLIGQDPDGAGWPSVRMDESAKDGFVEIDFWKELSKHLAPDAVAIAMEAGQEKARYVIGLAVAINAKGQSRVVDLAQIYKKAEALTKKPGKITRAEY